MSLEVLALEGRQLLSTVMVIPVTSTADSGPGTLRAAVAAADAATKPVVIEFQLMPKGAATITLTSGQLELSNTAVPITIDGPGASWLAVDGNHASGIFQIDPNVTASLSGLTIRDGHYTGNFFSYSAGGVLNEGTATLADVTLSGNVGGFHAGGLQNLGVGDVTLTDCSITGNRSQMGAGLENHGGNVTLINCSVTGNSCGSGGCLENLGAALTLIGTTVSDNPDSNGTALGNYTQGTLTLTDCTVSGEHSGPSGGYGIVSRAGQVTIANSTVEDFNGGGIWLDRGTMTLTGTTISGNANRGGITNGSMLTMTGCTISGNNRSDYGGGVSSFGNLAMTGCTITGNTAGIGGGGMALGGTSTLTDCTIVNNSAPVYGGGLSLYGGSLDLVACTISGNSSSTGVGGLESYSINGSAPQASLTDTLIAGNTGPGGQAGDIGGTAADQVTGSYNLIGTGGSGGLTAAGHNLLGVANPGLAPLGDYGGPTQTMALQPDSPARHAGVAVPGVTTDQRGFALDNPIDIGAFQSQPGPLVVDTAIDGLGSGPGQLSLRQAVNLADVLDGGATITFDNSAFAGRSVITLTAGQLELSNPTGPVAILGPGLGKLAINGGGANRVFQVDMGTSAILSGLTITGGVTAGDGGGLLNLGTVTLSGDAIVGNAAADGGGVANSGAAVILGSSIDGNAASADGGGVFNAGSLSMTLSDLSANAAGADGGGLYNRGTATLVFCTVDDNSASSGGGVYADASGQPVVLLGTEVRRNRGGNVAGRVIRP